MNAHLVRLVLQFLSVAAPLGLLASYMLMIYAMMGWLDTPVALEPCIVARAEITQDACGAAGEPCWLLTTVMMRIDTSLSGPPRQYAFASEAEAEARAACLRRAPSVCLSEQVELSGAMSQARTNVAFFATAAFNACGLYLFWTRGGGGGAKQ